MEKFLTSHPWLSTFIALSAINGLVYVIRGPNPAWSSLSQALGSPASPGVSAVKGLFATGAKAFPPGSPLHSAMHGQHPLGAQLPALGHPQFTPQANWSNW